ncbi:MAG: dephospho-CoA kinase [Oscillospiraceae bacterium]|nr:dephospho-CoA kinase [Oscillospiraceae bacterium]
MLIIGLTGPTGSGKSRFAAHIAAAGIPVIDTDLLAREVVEPGTPCLTELTETFSSDILFPDGSLDRRKLAEIAFATVEGAARLSAITHPRIIARTEEILNQLAGRGERLAVVEAPLLFESGLDHICSSTIAVTASKEQRLQRIQLRDNLTAEQAAARISVQSPSEYYAAHADVTLDGGCDGEVFDRLCLALIERIKGWVDE